MLDERFDCFPHCSLADSQRHAILQAALKGFSCFVNSIPGWRVSDEVELSHVNVRSSLFAFGIPAISILSPISSSSIACSIGFNFASAIAIFLSAVRNASSFW